MKFADMKGDDRVRHCTQCKLNVYNLSALSEADAIKLVTERENRICVTFFRRADGTVLTRDCEGGLVANFKEQFEARRGRSRGAIALAVAAVLAAIFALGVTIFGDNLRVLFGQQTTGALAGTPTSHRHRVHHPDEGF